MSQCKYNLTVDGNELVFDSIALLDQYILENKERLELQNKGMSVPWSDKPEDRRLNLLNAKMLLIKHTTMTRGEASNDYLAEFQTTVETPGLKLKALGFEGITRYTREKTVYDDGLSKQIVQSFQPEQLRKYMREKYIMREYTSLEEWEIGAKRTPIKQKEFDEAVTKIQEDPHKVELMEKTLDKVFDMYDLANKYGRIVHKSLEIVLKFIAEKGYDAYTDIDQMSTVVFGNLLAAQASELKDTDAMTIGIMAATLFPMVNDVIKNLHLKTLKLIYPEFSVTYDKDGVKLVGILDLIVVDVNNKIKLYDFKTSSKEEEQWPQAKHHTNVLQLGYYNAMFKALGITFDDVSIVPLLVVLGKSNEVEAIKVGAISSLMEHLQPNGKKMYNNIRKLISEDIPYVLDTQEISASGEIKDIDDFLQLTMDVDYTKQVDKRMLVKNFEYIWKNRVEDGVRKFWNPETSALEELPKDKEELKKHYVDIRTAYINKNSGAQVVKKYLRALETFKNDYNNSTSEERRRLPFVLSNDNNAHTKNTKYQAMFGKYKGDEWRILRNPTAEELGFILFLNDSTNIIDIISVSEEDLDVNVEMLGTTVMGKKFSDTKFVRDDKVLKATKGNIELMKIITFINFNSLFFENSNYKVGLLKSVSMASSGAFEDYNVLKHNFVLLCKHYNLENSNHLSSAAILVANPLMDLLATVSATQAELSKFGFADSASMLGFKDVLEENINAPNTEWARAKILELLTNELEKRIIGRSPEAMPQSLTEGDYFTKMIADLILYYGADYKSSFEKNISNLSLWSNTISNIPSKFIDAVRKVLGIATENIKTRFLEHREKGIEATENLFEEAGFGKLKRYTLGTHSILFQSLIQRDADNKLDSNFMLRDPFKDKTLTKAQKDYIIHFLTTINELKGVEKSIEEQSNDGEILFRFIPLIPATTLTHLKQLEISDAWSLLLDKIRNPDSYLFESTKVKDENYDKFLRLSTYLLSEKPDDRKARLEAVNLRDFETDLELVMDSFVLTALRSIEFTKALPLVLALKVSTIMENSGVLKDISPLLEFVQNHLTILVRGEKLIQKGGSAEKAEHFLSVARHLTTVFNLMLSPFNLIRESIQSFYAVVSRTALDRYGENHFKLKHLFQLFAIITGESRKNIYQDMNKVESLNILAGMTNMSTSQILDRLSINKTGIFHFVSRWMQGLNRAPEYMVRMGIYIGEMIKDGVWDAYTFNDDTGKLEYDWTKDERFSIFAKNLTTHPLYQKQRDAYVLLAQALNQENPNSFINFTEGKPLHSPYTNAEIESFKLFADATLGYYDTEKRIQFQATLFGINFMHFKTWMVAVKDKWYLKRQKSNVIGQRVPTLSDTGEQMYLTPTGELTTDATVGNEKLTHWEGNWNEGMLQSVGRLIEEARGGGLMAGVNLMKEDKLLQSNIKLMILDLLAILLMYFLLQFMFKGLKRQDDDYTGAFLRVMISAPSDLNPFSTIKSVTNTGWIFPSFGYLSQLGVGLSDVVFGDLEFKNWLFKSFGVLRPFQYYDK